MSVKSGDGVHFVPAFSGLGVCNICSYYLEVAEILFSASIERLQSCGWIFRFETDNKKGSSRPIDT